MSGYKPPLVILAFVLAVMANRHNSERFNGFDAADSCFSSVSICSTPQHETSSKPEMDFNQSHQTELTSIVDESYRANPKTMGVLSAKTVIREAFAVFFPNELPSENNNPIRRTDDEIRTYVKKIISPIINKVQKESNIFSECVKKIPKQWKFSPGEPFLIKISLEGHASREGDGRFDNEGLSKRRAEYVKTRILDQIDNPEWKERVGKSVELAGKGSREQFSMTGLSRVPETQIEKDRRVEGKVEIDCSQFHKDLDTYRRKQREVAGEKAKDG